MVALRDHALSRRRYAVDLVPAGCYWRDLTPAESKLDFAAIEAADGAALQGSRMRLGLLLQAQRNAVILRTRSERFSPMLARTTPAYLARQIANEFVRIHARGYADGVRQHNEASPGKPISGPGQSGTDRLVSEARAAGYGFARKVFAPVAKSLVDAFALTGQRVKEQPKLEAEIRTAYAKWLEPTQGDASEIRLATPLDVLEIGYEAWEQRNSPITGFLDVLFREMPEGAEQLTASATTAEISTERQRLLNAAVFESGLKDAATESYQFSAIRDSRTCAYCLSLDGVVRPKDDFTFWGFYTPPIHQRCRCSLITVLKSEKLTPTQSAEVDRLLESIGGKVPPGFGGYDPSLEMEFAYATRR
jgi:SPP1 gp7 family putative phage head morphogenesis protein